MKTPYIQKHAPEIFGDGKSVTATEAASERATSEPAGPAPVVAAVATGSNPASVGVLDMLEWKWRSIAAQHRKSAEQTQSSHESTRFKSAAEALEACALELRLLTGATTERQPESNNLDQTRGGQRSA